MAKHKHGKLETVLGGFKRGKLRSGKSGRGKSQAVRRRGQEIGITLSKKKK